MSSGSSDAVWQGAKRHQESLRSCNPPWGLSEVEKKDYKQTFCACDTKGTGFISSVKALEICRRTGIDKNRLLRICAFIRADLRGKLNLLEFEITMGLVNRNLGENFLPPDMPRELVRSASGELDKYASFQRTVMEQEHFFDTFRQSPMSPSWLEVRMVPASDVLHESFGCYVVRLGPGVVLKYGLIGNDHSEEIRCLKYVRRVTTIPVPRPLHHPRRGKLWYLCMEEASGVTLESCIGTMNAEQLDHIVVQLKSYLTQLRSLRPQQLLGSITGGPYSNAMFPVPPKHALCTVRDFNQYWLDILLLFSGSEFAEGLISQLPCNCAVIFAHADLVPRNIMVQGSTITAILDWAFAGWYPEYWEYCRMRSWWKSPNWQYVVHSIYQPREREWAATYQLTRAVWDVCG